MTRSLVALLGLTLMFVVAGPADVAWGGPGVQPNVRVQEPPPESTPGIHTLAPVEPDAPADAQTEPPLPQPGAGPTPPQAETPAEPGDPASEDDAPADDSEDNGEP